MKLTKADIEDWKRVSNGDGLKSVRKHMNATATEQVIREPMLAKDADSHSHNENKVFHMFAERKHDGVRARIIDGRLIDRRGNDITHKFPEFKGIENIDVPLDGEVVAQSGVFEDVSGRVHMKDKFKIRLSAKKYPARFTVFDIPVNGIPYETRKLAISQMFDESAFIFRWMQECEVFLVDNREAFDELWSIVKHKSWEGLVLKEVQHYYHGKRSSAWLKLKNFVDSIEQFDEYESHNKGIKLIQSETGRSVNINGAQAAPIAKMIDENGSVKAEVQYMEQLNSNRWRFPSFKRLAGEQ